VLGHHRRMAAGFALGTPGHLPFGPHLASFGHTGAGAFANPTARLGFTYVMNSFHAGPAPNPRVARGWWRLSTRGSRRRRQRGQRGRTVRKVTE
jgi:hypothetical protein